MTENKQNNFFNILDLKIDQIDYSGSFTNIQGQVAELVVREMHPDNNEMVLDFLKRWKNSDVGPDYKQGSAANIPDWAVVDEYGEVKELIEVKAVTSRESPDSGREGWINAWRQTFEHVTPDIDVKWKDRVSAAWPSSQEKILRQMKKHLERATTITNGEDNYKLSPELKMVLFVPKDESFEDWPEHLDVDGRKVQLVVKNIPSMSDLKEHVHKFKMGDGDASTDKSHKNNFLMELEQEKDKINLILERIVRPLGFKGDLNTLKHSDPTELDEINQLLAGMLTGGKVINSEIVLSAIGSAHPSLLAHFAYEIAKGKLPPNKKDLSNALVENLGYDEQTAVDLARVAIKVHQKIKSGGRLDLTDQIIYLPSREGNDVSVERPDFFKLGNDAQKFLKSIGNNVDISMSKFAPDFFSYMRWENGVRIYVTDARTRKLFQNETTEVFIVEGPATEDEKHTFVWIDNGYESSATITEFVDSRRRDTYESKHSSIFGRFSDTWQPQAEIKVPPAEKIILTSSDRKSTFEVGPDGDVLDLE